uniref:HMG box domain-containing protein n=1 Tax=Varanus komodoensis TaxID=61221 RepID=A0A8D2L0S9_VARKO
MAKGCCNRCSKKGGKLNPLRKAKSRRQQARSRCGARGRRRSGRRRPLPAFFLFMKDKRPALQCEHPDWTVIQMAKSLGSMWHQQPQADKERYKKKAA